MLSDDFICRVSSINKRKLEILETLHIKSSDNMNKKEDNNKIKNTCNGILQKIKRRKKSRVVPPPGIEKKT
jgi:hypothetical protein